MNNLLFFLHAFQDPWFWGFVIFPVLMLLALWPVIINYVDEKASRITRRYKK
jgi:hypothetical protein